MQHRRVPFTYTSHTAIISSATSPDDCPEMERKYKKQMFLRLEVTVFNKELHI